jgi:ABC-type transporter Mla subunit MlaD
VKSAGVVVGRVESITFDDKSFQARVTLAWKALPVPQGQLAEDPDQRPAG